MCKKPTAVWVKISEKTKNKTKQQQKKNINFSGSRSFESHFHFFKVDEIMSKYGHLMLPEAFPDKITPDIDFIDEAVVQCCDISVLKILLIYE